MKNRLFILILLSVCMVGFGDSVSAQKGKEPKEQPYGLPLLVAARSLGNCKPNNQTAFLKISETGEFILGEKQTAKGNLVDELKSYLCGKLPDEYIVYLRASGNTPFRHFAEAMKLGRKLEVDSYGLAFESDTGNETLSNYYRLKIPFTVSINPKEKPDPLGLIVSFGSDGKIALNKKEIDHTELTNELKKIFSARLKRKVYRQGSKEVEKTVFLRPTLSTKFEDIIKTIEAVKSADAEPIALSIDNLKEK